MTVIFTMILQFFVLISIIFLFFDQIVCDEVPRNSPRIFEPASNF